jgi:CDP-6-deoxy-D-xylo-4-hexulose-3-dehydrase
MPALEDLRQEILSLVDRYGDEARKPPAFEPGKTPIPSAGKVVGSPEMRLMVDAALDCWLTTGRFNEAFEGRLSWGASTY